ncbi:uncharacterized protein LOC119080265 isoform X5 [Bradysia coprophila]|uniref:uncharacterized protein LOC119080265 isoform X5 n=1 Tax=Bradysia coprophila TaxID=38358 RepID=UPI00187DBD06|nr:uncharacterized protein LOC119080265 isoform X5 [Bradysia coprophila]
MGVQSIWLTVVVLVFVDSSLANPLLEGGITGRTLYQQNMKCGTRSAFKRITMSSPTGSGYSQSCEYTIRGYSTKVCQIRVDFFSMDLEQPRTTGAYAVCTGEYVTIEGMQFDLCGILRNQHVYVPFDVRRITDEMKINFQVNSNSYARWDMEINQIECNHKAALVTPDERQAPDGCLQYFHQAAGRVDSFNFGNVYYGNTRYAICFNRNYNENAMLELSEITFQMDGIGAPYFDDMCLNGASGDSKDYIAIPFAEVTNQDPHSLFCGDSLDGEDVIFYGTGPIVIHVNTDRQLANDETGFSFRYRIRP